MLVPVLVVVAALALLLGAGHWLLFRRPLPRRSGRVVLPGLRGKVEILRDRHGIPHIFAASLEDATFAQGFVHAQDRLFQMELNRRVGNGQLAELFGAPAVEADRFLRRVGLRRAAERELQALGAEERGILEAYTRGVNEALATLRVPPLELQLLKRRPAPWTPADSLAWAKVMALNLSTNWDSELFRYRLLEKVGVEEATRLELRYPHEGAVAIPPGARHDSARASEELSRLYQEAARFLPLGLSGASNNWVVSGARTRSGKPMLANDPHLLLGIPNIWYEVHLVTPDVDVYGVSLPGDPGVVIGHTRTAAWGVTNSGADAQDLYLERFDPADPRRVEYNGGFEPVQVVREVIKVQGAPDVVEEVLITRHGPIVSGPVAKGEVGIALRWTAHEPGNLFGAVLGLNRARTAQDIRQALRQWHTPSQNFVFADADGNIGYLMAGAIPMRKRGSGLTPVPGWTDEYEWAGYIPFDELPQAWNPESGYVVTANNAVVDRAFKHHITWDWMNGYRAERIERLLLQRGRVDADDFRDIQMDVFCAPGKAFAERCRDLRPEGPREQLALAALKRWDGHATAESVGACVYEAMILSVMQRAVRPRIGQELFEQMLGRAVHPLAPAGLIAGRYTGFVFEAMADEASPLLQSAPGYPSWAALLLAALSDATAVLSERLGDDVERWAWGRLHLLAFKHPMGRVALLAPVFNGPTLRMGGDSDTPLQTAVAGHKPFGVDAWAPSWRQVVDFGDVRGARSIIAGGQSGHPGSPHYLDQLERWHQGRYHEQWLDRRDIEANLEARLELVPA